MPSLRQPRHGNPRILGYRVDVHCVLARDPEGRVHHRYQGDIIDWLDDDQAEHWPPRGLVTPILDQTAQTDTEVELVPPSAPPRAIRKRARTANPTAPAPEDSPADNPPNSLDPTVADEAPDSDPTNLDQPVESADADRVSRCIEALDDLGVDPWAGAPVSRAALRVLGLHKFSNDTIAAAVKTRKATLSGTASAQ